MQSSVLMRTVEGLRNESPGDISPSMIVDTAVGLKLFWPLPERDSEHTVSVCGESDACKTISSFNNAFPC